MTLRNVVESECFREFGKGHGQKIETVNELDTQSWYLQGHDLRTIVDDVGYHYIVYQVLNDEGSIISAEIMSHESTVFVTVVEQPTTKEIARVWPPEDDDAFVVLAFDDRADRYVFTAGLFAFKIKRINHVRVFAVFLFFFFFFFFFIFFLFINLL